MTQKETFAHKGGPEAMASRVLEQIDERLNEKVREGLITVDEAMTEIKKVRAEFDDWREKVDAEQRKLQMPGSSEGYSLGRVAQACMAGGSQSHYEKHAPHEWSVSQEYAQATGPDTSGGFYIPGEVRSELIIEKVRPSSVALSLGAQEMNFTSTPVEIPRESGSVLAPTSKGENATLDSQDVEFGQLRMNPRLTGLIVKGSRRFFSMGEAADPFISNILAREMRIKIDTYALKGTGAQDQPIGILNASGVNSVDFGASPAAANNDYLVYEHLVEMSALPLENGNHETMSRPGWAIAAKAHRAFQTIKSENASAPADSGEVARKVLTDSKIDRLLGDPFRATTLLTSGADTELIFGDWQQCVVGFWGGMQIESTEVGGTAFESHQRWLKATVEMDVGIWHPDAFSVSTNYDVTGI
jgi:HK97 family phage major capsid protein